MKNALYIFLIALILTGCAGRIINPPATKQNHQIKNNRTGMVLTFTLEQGRSIYGGKYKGKNEYWTKLNYPTIHEEIEIAKNTFYLSLIINITNPSQFPYKIRVATKDTNYNSKFKTIYNGQLPINYRPIPLPLPGKKVKITVTVTILDENNMVLFPIIPISYTMK